jgi:hypothetical protein
MNSRYAVTGDFATAAQGAKADTALQNAAAFATAAQGAKADTALQNAAAFATAAQGATADAAWSALQSLPVPFSVQVGQWETRAVAGVDGGVLGGAENVRELNTAVLNLTGSTLTGGNVRLPAGSYYAQAWAAADGIGTAFLWVITTLGVTLARGPVHVFPAGVAGVCRAEGPFTLAAQEDVMIIQYLVTPPPGAATDGGRASNYDFEVHAGLTIWRLS